MLLALSVEVGVIAGVLVPVAVEELDGVPDPLCVAVAELLKEFEPVLDEEAPTETEGVGDNDAVLLPLNVVLIVAFPVPLAVCVAVPVGVGEGVRGLVGDAGEDIAAVWDGEAPADIDAVGLGVTVELALSVVVGVCVAVPVPVCVGEPVGKSDPLCVAVSEMPVLEGEAPAVSDAMGEEYMADNVALQVAALDELCAPLLHADIPALKSAVGIADTAALLLSVGMGPPVAVLPPPPP